MTFNHDNFILPIILVARVLLKDVQVDPERKEHWSHISVQFFLLGYTRKIR